MAQVKGVTRAERDRARASARRANEIAYAHQLGNAAGSGHDKVKAAGRVALAASGRMTNEASLRLAAAIAEAAAALDVPANWRTDR